MQSIVHRLGDLARHVPHRGPAAAGAVSGGVAGALVRTLRYDLVGGSPGMLLVLVAVVAIATFAAVALARHLLHRRRSRRAGGALGRLVGDTASKRFEQDLADPTLRRLILENPWYLVIGPVGSGKTALITNGGLTLSRSLHIEDPALNNEAGTWSVDLWYTQNGLFLDTAGRLADHDQDDALELNRREWTDFVKRLRRARPQRPVHGVIVTVPMNALIAGNADEIDQLADLLLRRLHEVGSQFRMRLPVYVVVTKCDLLDGFSDFFASACQRGEHEQMLGWSAAGRIGGISAADVQTHLESLRRDLCAYRSRAIVEGTADVNEGLFSFPRQLETIERNLATCLARLSDDGMWSNGHFIRGLYFTSSLQQGEAVDAAEARRRGVTADELSHRRQEAHGRVPYFTKELLTKKIVVEKDFGEAVTNTPAAVRIRRAARVAAAASVLWIGWTAWSMAALGDIDGRMEAWKAVRDANASDGAPNFDDPALVAAARSVDRDLDVPLPMQLAGAGLDGGGDRLLEPQTRGAIAGLLSRRIVQPLAHHLWDEVKQASSSRSITDAASAIGVLDAARDLRALEDFLEGNGRESPRWRKTIETVCEIVGIDHAKLDAPGNRTATLFEWIVEGPVPEGTDGKRSWLAIPSERARFAQTILDCDGVLATGDVDAHVKRLLELQAWYANPDESVVDVETDGVEGIIASVDGARAEGGWADYLDHVQDADARLWEARDTFVDGGELSREGDPSLPRRHDELWGIWSDGQAADADELVRGLFDVQAAGARCVGLVEAWSTPPDARDHHWGWVHENARELVANIDVLEAARGWELDDSTTLPESVAHGVATVKDRVRPIAAAFARVLADVSEREGVTRDDGAPRGDRPPFPDPETACGAAADLEAVRALAAATGAPVEPKVEAARAAIHERLSDLADAWADLRGHDGAFAQGDGGRTSWEDQELEGAVARVAAWCADQARMLRNAAVGRPSPWALELIARLEEHAAASAPVLDDTATKEWAALRSMLAHEGGSIDPRMFEDWCRAIGALGGPPPVEGALAVLRRRVAIEAEAAMRSTDKALADVGFPYAPPGRDDEPIVESWWEAGAPDRARATSWIAALDATCLDALARSGVSPTTIEGLRTTSTSLRDRRLDELERVIETARAGRIRATVRRSSTSDAGEEAISRHRTDRDVIGQAFTLLGGCPFDSISRAVGIEIDGDDPHAPSDLGPLAGLRALALAANGTARVEDDDVIVRVRFRIVEREQGSTVTRRQFVDVGIEFLAGKPDETPADDIHAAFVSLIHAWGGPNLAPDVEAQARGEGGAP